MLLFCATNGFCQTFDEYFTDKTLRIDYIFSGKATDYKSRQTKHYATMVWQKAKVGPGSR